MTQHVTAIYEQAVLKPLEPLDLADQDLVSLTIDKVRDNSQVRSNDAETRSAVLDLPEDDRPVWERIATLAAALPEHVIAGLPDDGASEHDHYIYGLPKRGK